MKSILMIAIVVIIAYALGKLDKATREKREEKLYQKFKEKLDSEGRE